MSGEFDTAVSARLRLVVADLLDDGVFPADPAFAERVLTATGTVLAAHPYPHRRRAARQKVASLAAVYLRLLRPPPGWLPVDTSAFGPQFSAGPAWRTPDGDVLLDELTAVGATQPRFDRAGMAKLQFLLSEADSCWGASFVGVRWLTLGAPRCSLLLTGFSDRTPLTATPWWFDPTVATTRAKAGAA